MKKGWVILALIILFLVPIVSAKITILSQYNDFYNYGDTLSIDGYILAETNIDDDVKITLDCEDFSDEKTYDLVTIAGQKVDFSTFGAEDFTIPDNAGKQECKFQITYGPDGVNSELFEITKDLDGFFVLENSELELGDNLVVNGYVFKQNGENVESGDAVIFVDEGDELKSLGSVEILDGLLSFNEQLVDISAGVYSYGVRVTDDNGNSYEFEDYGIFSVESHIDFTVEVSDDVLNPGEEFTVYGQVESDNAVTVSVLYDEVYEAEVAEDNSYSVTLTVPDNAAPQVHEVQVTVEDSFGNSGTSSTVIYVNQVATSLENVLSSVDFLPAETLTAATKILDQTGAEMTGKVDIVVYDPNGGELYSGQHSAGEEIEFVFAKYSLPGKYEYDARYEELEKLTELEIAKVEETSYYVRGDVLYFTNEGNVLYEDTVTVYLISVVDGDKRTYVVEEDVSLQPGGKTQIDLSEEVPSGEYEVVVDDGLGTIDISKIDEESLATVIESEIPEEEIETVEVSSDNRPLMKKFNQGISSVTGAAVIETEEKGIFSTLLYILVIVLVVGVLGTYVYRNYDGWMDGLNNWLEKDMKKPTGKSQVFDKGVAYKQPFKLLNEKEEVRKTVVAPEPVNVDEAIPTEKKGFDPSTIKRPEWPGEEDKPEIKDKESVEEEQGEKTEETTEGKFWDENAKKAPLIDDLDQLEKDFIDEKDV